MVVIDPDYPLRNSQQRTAVGRFRFALARQNLKHFRLQTRDAPHGLGDM